MAFNKGYELKKFEAHWEKLRIEYAAAGMAEDAIQKMYDYDRQQFNSERTCIERTQEFTAPAYESTEEEASPLILRYQEAITTTDTYHETKRSFAWIGEIEDENLLAALEQLSDSDLELITLYAYEEYDTVEISKLFGTTKYAFIVATHTDREHIHNHIIYNSTALDSTRKFRDFLLSGLAVQRLSDLICLEHQLSVIEIKPYRERQKRTLYPPRESNRDKLCAVIDNILLNEKPASFEGFLQKLEQQGYEIKRGKYTSVKGTRQKRFIRFRTLGAGYSEDEIKAVIAGESEHRPYQKQPPKEQPFHLLVDIQAKLSEGKSEGYARWAKRYNLKEMSKTLIFLQENKIGSIEEMQERVDTATAHYHELGDSIKASEKRLAEIAVLKAHIINYAKTRPAPLTGDDKPETVPCTLKIEEAAFRHFQTMILP